MSMSRFENKEAAKERKGFAYPHRPNRKAVFLPWESVERIMDEWCTKFFADYPVEGVWFRAVMHPTQHIILSVSGTEIGLSLDEYLKRLVELYGEENCNYDPTRDLGFHVSIHGAGASTCFPQTMSRNIFAAAALDAGLGMNVERMICDESGVVVMSEKKEE